MGSCPHNDRTGVPNEAPAACCSCPRFCSPGRPAMPAWASLKVRSKFNCTPATPGCAAERNLPLVESAWLRTGASSRLEIELDEGSAWRLGRTRRSRSPITRASPRASGSPCSRWITGWRISPASLAARDTLMLAVPGAQVTLLARRARALAGGRHGRAGFR